MKRYRKWTRAENEAIAAARQSGKALREIAAEHGATVNQIVSKLHFWGLCRARRPRVEPWEREWRLPAAIARAICKEGR